MVKMFHLAVHSLKQNIYYVANINRIGDNKQKRQTNKYTNIQTNKHTNKHTHTHTNKQINIQTNKQTYLQTNQKTQKKMFQNLTGNVVI